MTKARHRFSNAKRRRPESHDRQRMLTPSYVVDPIANLLGGIALDPCTEPENPCGAEFFYTPPTDGCAESWDYRNVFVNPPYGEARGRWVERCIAEGATRPVVLLIPSHTETRIFQRALENCRSVVFVRARLRFAAVRKNGQHEAASHGSAILGFGVDVSALELGVAMSRVQA